MASVAVEPSGPHSYRVAVFDDGRRTTHQVTVPEDLLTAFKLDEDDEARLVELSFAFLLEREPASSILSRFSLSVIERYFPDYRQDLLGRL